MTNSSAVTIIIRVRDEERWIGHCIQSILDFIKETEIIIINDNSQDEGINSEARRARVFFEWIINAEEIK